MTTIDFMIGRVTGGEIPRFSADDLADARTLVLEHLFRFRSWLSFNDTFEQQFGHRWTYADRECLLSDALVMRGLRFVLYDLLYHHAHLPVRQLKDVALQKGLDRYDLPLLRLCVERLQPHVEDHKARGYRPLTLAQFDSELAAMWQQNTRFVAGYSWTHLRFLAHWNLSLDHIQADLCTKAMSIVTEMYPTFKNRGHMHTIYRSVIQQVGLKLIKRYRSQKRSIMDSDNFKSSVSLDATLCEGSELDLHSFLGDDSHRVMSVKAEAASLVARITELEYGADLVHLLCGDHPDTFVEWMRRTHHVINLDTYAERYPAQYLRRCLLFCNIDPQTFIDKVGDNGVISPS